MTVRDEIEAPGCTWCGRVPVEQDIDVATLGREEMLRELVAIVTAGEQVEERLRSWVATLREHKVSWASIGAALGTSRQAAWERFTRTRTGHRQGTGSEGDLEGSV